MPPETRPVYHRPASPPVSEPAPGFPAHVPAKGCPLILLAFLLPFSVYLLVIGMLNRRPHPIMVPGTWDFVGLVFAASGFLLVGGPAVLSSGSEGWRMFWLFGSRDALRTADGTQALWPVLAAVYFALVVGGVSILLFRRRALTAVYNVEPDAFEKALARVFGTLRLNPIRSGNLFVFSAASRPPAEESIRAAPAAPPAERPRGADAGRLTHGAVLEVDPFSALRHVTLRWEPAGSPLRREVEAELSRTLTETRATDHSVGDWLVLVAMALIAFNLLATCGLTISNLLRR